MGPINIAFRSSDYTSFLDLKVVPGLNTTVGIIFRGSDKINFTFVKVIGYYGKITELDSFTVLLDYHGVLMERRLDIIYPIPLSEDFLIQFGWVKSGDIEKDDGRSYKNNTWKGSIHPYVSLKVIYYPKRDKDGKWVLSIKDIRTMAVNYYRVKWYHDLSRIYEFLKGVSGRL